MMESEHLNGSATRVASSEAWLEATDGLVSTEHAGRVTVCDTSFDGGLRFLALWSFWRRHRSPGARLQIIACSPPQSWAAMKQARGETLPAALQVLDEALEAQWPDALPGIHRLSFEHGAVTLTLVFHPLSVALRQIDAIVDVFWVSDSAAFSGEAGGASPAGKLVRIAGASAQVIGLADGNAQRLCDVLQQAGFQMCRANVPFDGFVRGRLRARLCHTRRSVLAGADVLVVGAGVAGAAIAWGLAQRGHHVKVFDPMLRSGQAGTHEGHYAAAVSPYLSKDDDYRARLSRAGVARAWANWSELEAPARPIRCGTLGLPTPDRGVESWQEMLGCLNFPDSWAGWLEPEAASRQANELVESGGCYRASGLLVKPNRLLPALLGHTGVFCIDEAVAEVKRAGQIGWQVETDSGSIYEAPVVVLANARSIGPLLSQLTEPGELPRLERMQAVPGQVSYFDAAGFDGGPDCVLDASAYWLPEVEGMLTAGGTYELEQASANVTHQGHREIARKLSQFLPAHREALSGPDSVLGGWAGWRAVVTGRLPVIGPLSRHPGIWLATAYGSRGLTWAALAADLIGARLNDEPAIVERDLFSALSPR
jgi:tRNA 5-methylaminomethyl-2-thiouridine biosynthesis bifunctional protein|tara:strand:- start:105495 stop:107285 length:1791 start_codon:yes stop_codon:yes gene_type:complete